MTAAQLIAKFNLPEEVKKHLPSWRGAELTDDNKTILLNLIYNNLLENYSFAPYPKTLVQIENWEARQAVVKSLEEGQA